MGKSSDGRTAATLADELTRSMPAADRVQLGALLQDLIAAQNAQNTAVTALLAKLDADAGVTDTNYAALIGADLPATVGDLASR